MDNFGRNTFQVYLFISGRAFCPTESDLMIVVGGIFILTVNFLELLVDCA